MCLQCFRALLAFPKLRSVFYLYFISPVSYFCLTYLCLAWWLLYFAFVSLPVWLGFCPLSFRVAYIFHFYSYSKYF